MFVLYVKKIRITSFEKMEDLYEYVKQRIKSSKNRLTWEDFRVYKETSEGFICKLFNMKKVKQINWSEILTTARQNTQLAI